MQNFMSLQKLYISLFLIFLNPSLFSLQTKNSKFYNTCYEWSQQAGSNCRPLGYESSALPTELYWHILENILHHFYSFVNCKKSKLEQNKTKNREFKEHFSILSSPILLYSCQNNNSIFIIICTTR